MVLLLFSNHSSSGADGGKVGFLAPTVILP